MEPMTRTNKQYNPFHLSLACLSCGAVAGQACVNASGAPTRVHAVRENSVWIGHVSREMIFRLRQDQLQFNLHSGDEVVCIGYPFTAKVIVLRRLRDGFDPNCSLDNLDVEFIRWHEPSNAGAEVLLSGPPAAEGCRPCCTWPGERHHTMSCLRRMESERARWIRDNADEVVAFYRGRGGVHLLPWQEEYVREGMPTRI